MSTADVPAALRARLARVADGLIPGTERMPAPSDVDVGGGQLDLVLGSRPDLAAGLARALAAAADAGGDAVAWLEALAVADPPAADALATCVVAAYYLHPEVQRRLGYPGQVARTVEPDTYPAYVDEGQLERVLERGPIYRPTPGPAPA